MNRGIITIYVVIFGSIFLLMMSGLFGFILLQNKQSLQGVSLAQSLDIAEAGIDYAKWHLAQAPSDLNFSGTYDYKNIAGETIGQYFLEITPPSGCDSAMNIKSSGWTLRSPEVVRKIQIKYAKPALVQYALLSNANVWFAEEDSPMGQVHSNGGIRMDGTQNSLFTSAKETYTCDESHGCSPPQEKPGIWGDSEGGEQGLWQFPVDPVNFDALTQDLETLKADAMSSGVYISQPVDHGYHLKFKEDGTVDVFRVKKVKPKVWGWDGEQWLHEANDIDSEDFYANYQLPASCAPIFVENNVWVDGEVKGRVTLVAATMPEQQNKMRKIIINGNIDYADNESVLGLIAQKDVLIPFYSPDELSIKASMLAKDGHVMRYYYENNIKEKIETYGSIITNAVWTFSFGTGGEVVSGYESVFTEYDPKLTYSPPPYFPTFGEYKIMDWQELQ